ncbi:pickpocket protein 28 [Folsomia candida]|uniref:pickpocket protein 28 n=1 Tax=Folsomia candida TaxID=158441 RepID=UPI001604BFE8|nr:pickpocket protein 28 [Folsomia candida]XP_035716750.1 pickpocket protein 28 [Folsomia candida]
MYFLSLYFEFSTFSPPKNRKHDLEVMIQEKEYEYLQRAVWEYTDTFRSKNSGGGGGSSGGGNKGKGDGMDDTETGSTTADNFNCARIYDDDLFPGICQYLQRCRDSGKCRERNRIKTNASSSKPIGSGGATQTFNFFAEQFPLKVAGAGRSRGLQLMIDSLRCDSIPTDSFKGLRVFVHNADDFPAVAERGYIVGPGLETQIGVTAVDTYSGDVLRGFSAKTRGCFFPDEFPLKFYKEYSRSACIVECETEFVFQECQCVTYFSPGNYSVCTLKKFQECVKKALDAIQKKNLPTAAFELSPESTMFNFKSKKDREQDKSCAQFCLPSCNETFYNVFVTAADFPNQPLANQTKMLREAIVEGGLTHLNDISYVSGSISVLRIFFRESSIMQYKRDELFTWEDFVSALGGVMSLCMGFSIISLVEAVYFFTFRMHMDKKKMTEIKTVAEFVK